MLFLVPALALILSFCLLEARGEQNLEPAGSLELEGLDSAVRIQIRFDTSTPTEFLRLLDKKIIDDDSLDRWIDLPGNREILRIGTQSKNLSREQFRDNLWHSILGHVGRRGHGLGNLDFEPLDDLRAILLELEARENGIASTVSAHIAEYLPPEIEELDAVVRFHLGGTWGARTSDQIYYNLTRVHEFRPPWLGSIEVILAHELVHLAHASLGVLPGDAKSSEGLFGVAIAQIHSEGYARHVGFDLMEKLYTPGGYAHFVHRRHRSELSRFAESMKKIDEIRKICLRRTGILECRKKIRSGVRGQGDAYAVGHGMAKAIERALGRKMLATTLVEGPGEFFKLYAQATRMLDDLPPLGEGFERDLRVAVDALREMEDSWRLRREAHAMHTAADYAGAAGSLKALLELEPYDEVAAYNLACALAMMGKQREAMMWLSKSVKLGYKNRDHLAQDPDLSTLRQREDFRRLLDSLDGLSASSPNTSIQ